MKGSRRNRWPALVALAALLAALGGLFVMGRGSPFRLVDWAKRGSAAEPTGSPREVAMVRAGRRLTRAVPPQFVPLTPEQAKVRTIQEVAEENRPLIGAFRRALLAGQSRDLEAANVCAWEFMNRNPDYRKSGFNGKLALSFTVAAGKGRVSKVEALEGSEPDQLFVDCYAGATSWASGEWEIPDGADGTWTLMWPYHFGPAEAAGS
jgi:hypothetical protein